MRLQGVQPHGAECTFIALKNKDHVDNPVATGGFGGLSTPKQSTKPLKLKHERLLHQWSFFHQFFNVKPSLLKTFWRRFCMWNAALKTGNLTSRIVRCALSAQ